MKLIKFFKNTFKQTKVIKNIEIFTILHLLTITLSFEILVGIIKFINIALSLVSDETQLSIFDYNENGLSIIIAFIVALGIINVFKYYIAIPVLEQLCPEGEKSLVIPSSDNNGINTVIQFVNQLIQKAVKITKKRTLLGKLLLYIIGFIYGIAVIGILSCAFNKYRTGIFFVILGESTRIFLWGYVLL